jgi:hypothetical protein
MKTAQIQIITLLFCSLGIPVWLVAQVTTPTIKNKTTGKVIATRPIGAAATAVVNPSQIATRTFSLTNGGTHTVKLMKGNNSAVFTPRLGGASSGQSGNLVCTQRSVSGEMGGIEAANLSPATQAIYQVQLLMV